MRWEKEKRQLEGEGDTKRGGWRYWGGGGEERRDLQGVGRGRQGKEEKKQRERGLGRSGHSEC